MKIHSIFHSVFKEYGQVLTGYDLHSFCEVFDRSVSLPEHPAYVPGDPCLEAHPAAQFFQNNVYGGMPVEIGWCCGHNTRLNCLEYHRDSEVNVGATDFILLLAKREEIVDGVLSTDRVKAFYVPAFVPVEVYATTLHYTPCNAAKDRGFKVAVVLPKLTNTELPAFSPCSSEDRFLFARNKWLLAHADSPEAKSGAAVALTGENIDIAALLD